jgi:osmotically inducible protein OsmC
MEPLYTATATAQGGRKGKVSSSDGNLQHELSMPKGLGGDGGSGTNPEQLFAAGYAACFESALSLVAKKQNVSADEATVTANVSIGKDGEGFKLAVELEVHIPSLDSAKIEELAEAAHQVCPYSKATRGNIDVTIKAAAEPSATNWGR